MAPIHMSKINAKQIDGALDTSSSQQVTGQKTFSSAQTFLGGMQSVIINDGYIYWVANPNMLNEDGNSRMRLVNGILEIEVHQREWMPG
jgi:hypothetical protein|tara:strand:+ start:20652 stop:20918 length:267 start_codon:yes stop_codon:yes gene_type:complete